MPYHTFHTIFLFFLAIFLITSCATTTIEGVVIKNSTNKDIKISNHFSDKTYPPSTLDLMLKPGEDNLWQYEIEYFEEKVLDEGLKKMILSNESGCTVVLERNRIEEIAIKNGMWLINIDKNTMNCK